MDQIYLSTIFTGDEKNVSNTLSNINEWNNIKERVVSACKKDNSKNNNNIIK